MPDRVFGQRVLISRADIARTRLDDGGAPPDLEEGQALFAVDRVALTANNVTYAAMGEQMGYWRFFPAPEGWGILPVWGFATCTASRAKGIEEGDRFYGYWPLAEQLVVETERVDGSGFVDPSAHRQGLAAPYNRYNRRGGDGDGDGDDREEDETAENLEALLRPLFATGWLLARALHTAKDYGAAQVVISSASSKTAMAAAWTLAGRDPNEERPVTIGLTSAANVEFTRSLGIYDRVLPYGDLDSIDAGQASVYLDFTGDAELRARVHEHLGGHLGRSIAVGLTHWRELEETREIPGPEAKLFFAPDAIEQQQQTHGHGEFVRQNEEAWAAFAGWARPHVETRTIGPLTEAEGAYRELAAGRIGGPAGLIVRPRAAG